jgi:hypothetical protein
MARRIAEALQALGYGIWRDEDLPSHRAWQLSASGPA